MNAQVPAVIERAERSAMTAGTVPRAIVPETLDQVWRFAQLIVASGMAPTSFKTPESITVAIMHGLELGLTPLAALQSIAVVNGKPTVYGDGAMALVRGSGLCEWIEETLTGDADGITATCRAKRRGDPKPVISAFSVADAKKAGLWGKQGPWQQYPRRMLAMRARAFCLRDGFADVLRGVAIREEQEDVERHRASDARAAPAPKVVARRAPPEPPAEDAGPAATADTAPVEGEVVVAHDQTDWISELAAYGNMLSGVEAHQELAETIETYGAIYTDAPDDIRAAATKLEQDRRDAIGEDTTDTDVDPHAALLNELRSEVMAGKRVVNLLHDLPPDRRALITEDDRKKLTAAQKAVEAQSSGAAP